MEETKKRKSAESVLWSWILLQQGILQRKYAFRVGVKVGLGLGSGLGLELGLSSE